MAFVAPNQGYGAPVFHPTQAPYPSSNPINPRLLLLHQLLRSPDGNTYNHPNLGFHHFPGQLITTQPGGTVTAPGQPGIHWFGPGGSGIAYPQPSPTPVPATGIAPPSEPGGVPGPTQDAAAEMQQVQAMQDAANAQPHPAVHANIAAVQAAHEQAVRLAQHMANRRVLRPVRLRRGNPVM